MIRLKIAILAALLVGFFCAPLRPLFPYNLTIPKSLSFSKCAEWKPFILGNAFFIKTDNAQRAFEHRTTA